jgi:cellobiose phosphorylase
MYRLLLETLLGINLEGDQLRLTPNLPRTWSTFTLHYRYRQTPYHIRITRLPATSPGGSQLSLDGQELAGNTISLIDDHGDHSVELQIGENRLPPSKPRLVLGAVAP